MFEDLDRLAERLIATAPDQESAELEPALDTDGALVDELTALARVTAAAEARTMVVLTALCTRAQTWQDIHDPNLTDPIGPEGLVAAEIGPALRQTPATAAIRVERAVRIVTRLPATLRLFAAGRLDLGRVLAIDDATRCLSDADAARVEALVLGRAVEQTAGELRAALGKAVIRVDPAAAERRRKQAVKDRSVTRYQDRDGTSVLRAVLSAVDTGEIYDLIDQVARRTKTEHDPRTPDQRRADAFVQLLTGRDPHLGPLDDDTAPPGPAGPAGPDDGNGLGPAGGPGPGQPLPPPADADASDHDQDDADRDLDQAENAHDAGFGEPANDWVTHPGPGDPVPGEPVDPETVPPDPEQALVNTGWRNEELNRFERISELAALALSAMTIRRPPRLPWVTINTTTGADGQPVDVGELQGYGPITADWARHLLGTGGAVPPPKPSGREPTFTQAHTHDPPGWLADEIKTRDGTCRYPGCRQPAHRTDLDHVIPFPHGLTVRTNLGGLCRRHHRIKGTGTWHVTQHDNGTYQWTSRITGRTYTTHPRGTTGEWRGSTAHQ